ncbi:flagellar hook protein FlgE [Rhodospirillum sp. A1_3_36]|uniref:flagellar hook protein FlgE n=1 Tax=Rhodospirillum sp. A1_3_36 TaxID=3391666 RepID=UPI0039A66C56
MSLMGAFTNSSMAMTAQSHALGQISTNVTNVNTAGYRQVDTNFKTLLSETTARFDFFGTKPVDYRRVSGQGAVLQTGRDMDLAIGGTGLFMVNPQLDGSGETLYTRAGDFQARQDEASGDSYLTTSGGYYLMGWAADEAAVQAGTEPFPVNDPATGSVTGGAGLVPIKVNSLQVADGKATSSVEVRANLDADASTTQTLGINVWGPQYSETKPDGTTTNTWPRQSIKMQFQPDPANQNTWTLSLTDANGNTGTASPSTLVFDGGGRLTNPPDGMLTFDMTYANGTTGSFTVDMSEVTQYGGQTRMDETTANGYPEGSLSSTSFDETGVLSGRYTNGTTRPLFKLAMADFTAVDNLEAKSGTLFAASDYAGDRRILSASDTLSGGVRLTPGALEQSTTDLTDQFSRMITTQTAYSSAANVFRTADEMSQTAAGLKR